MTETRNHPEVNQMKPPSFFVYKDLGAVYALSEDDDLLYSPLMKDGSYSVDTDEYSLVEIDDCDENLEDTLIWIHSRLMDLRVVT